MKLEFSLKIFEKKNHTPIFIKMRAVRAELFHAGGQADMRKLIVAFRNFANALKNVNNNLFHNHEPQKAHTMLMGGH